MFPNTGNFLSCCYLFVFLRKMKESTPLWCEVCRLVCFETVWGKPMLTLNDPNGLKNTTNVYSIHLKLRMALPCQIREIFVIYAFEIVVRKSAAIFRSVLHRQIVAFSHVGVGFVCVFVCVCVCVRACVRACVSTKCETANFRHFLISNKASVFVCIFHSWLKIPNISLPVGAADYCKNLQIFVYKCLKALERFQS